MITALKIIGALFLVGWLIAIISAIIKDRKDFLERKKQRI